MKNANETIVRNTTVLTFLQESANDKANYQNDVLEFNKKLKEEQTAFGYTIKMLTAFKEFLPKGHYKMLQAAKKDQSIYEFLKDNVRTIETKEGQTKYNAFYLRQLLHKIASGKLQKEIASSVTSVETKGSTKAKAAKKAA